MNNSLNLIEVDQEQSLNLAKFFIKANKNIFFLGRPGVGKMLDLETELPTPNGFVKLKNLKEGDQLFDENGNVCNIIQLHPIDNDPESYKISFDDGTTVNACADHLWPVWDRINRNNKKTGMPIIKSTKDLISKLKIGGNNWPRSNYSIQCCSPLNYNNKILNIDPYVLGCWLGDGASATGNIECADESILDEIKFAGYTLHKTSDKTAKLRGSKSSNFRIGDRVFNDGKPTIGLLRKQLRDLNLLKNKHIPDIYLHSSYKQRLSLLQGLMDTDGSCSKDGLIEFCSVLPKLAYQVLELINSLGIKARLHKSKSFLYNKKCKDRYRITLITKLPIFRLNRKLVNLKKSIAQCNRNTHRYITNIEPIISLPMRCITVDSKSHLYLITRSFIPTHNTHISIQAAKECNYKINYINLSVIERPDLAGYPNINSPGDVITFKSPNFLPKLLELSKPDHIILFDEVDKAPPEVTAPLLEILQFKTINGVPLNVASCILTGNLSDDRSYSNQISSALLDRGAKYILSFSMEKWIDWAKANNVHDLILGFLRSNPEFACGKSNDTAYASPSPRGWTLASDALIKAKEYKISDIETISQIISGFVGCEAGLKFKIWYEYYRKFEPFVHALIDTGSMVFDFNSLVPTEKIVFAISACYYAKQKVLEDKYKNKFSYLENLCKFFIQYNVDHEIQVMGLYNSFSFEQIAKYKLYECKMFFELFTKISESLSLKNKYI